MASEHAGIGTATCTKSGRGRGREAATRARRRGATSAEGQGEAPEQPPGGRRVPAGNEAELVAGHAMRRAVTPAQVDRLRACRRDATAPRRAALHTSGCLRRCLRRCGRRGLTADECRRAASLAASPAPATGVGHFCGGCDCSCRCGCSRRWARRCGKAGDRSAAWHIRDVSSREML